MEHTLNYKSPPQYATYKRRHLALHGNSSDVISKETFSEISAKNCHYCGVKGPNGIDRVDSCYGYILSNCVPACKHCNYVKGNLTIELFEEWRDRFVLFNRNR